MAKAKKQPEENKNEELENQLKRALADYQNLERRVSEERKLLSQLSTAIIVEKFLPILDNLEVAQSHLNDPGLAMVTKQFKDVLASEGIEEIGQVGEQFDPNLHEAAEVVVGENQNAVVKVINKGYKMEGKVIRPAKVTVSRKSESAQASGQEQAEQGGLNE
ncbi:nucleotide exchange factor GrpE [Candidatus Curtissbacteria bacterium]|nr:nucleotide exchange factor GrpE [Candidatus Curtissbacteria bacterium]